MQNSVASSMLPSNQSRMRLQWYLYFIPPLLPLTPSKVRFALSSEKRFSQNSGFKYKDMYYAIIKFVKRWPETKVQQLLAKWDR